jgi:hypothetical protein
VDGSDIAGQLPFEGGPLLRRDPQTRPVSGAVKF